MSGYEMFDAMSRQSYQEDTLRLLYHVRIEQKVEREEVAKVRQERIRMSPCRKRPKACRAEGILSK